MFSLSDKEKLENSRELRYKAECALLDSIDVLAAIVSMPVKNKADRIYCYCSLKGQNALFGAFYTEGDKATQFNDIMDKSEFMDLNMAVISQLAYLKSQYEGCEYLMPAELFLQFVPKSGEKSGMAGMEFFPDPYDSVIRFNAWLKENGGEPMPAGPRQRTFGAALKYRLLKQGEEEAHNPTEKAVEIDMKALERSRKYIAGEADEPALLSPETGWDAVRAEMARAYSGDAVPMSFESDDGKSWIDVYDAKNIWKYVSCAFSPMGYEADAATLGAEYTLSLKKKANQDEDDIQIFTMLNMMRAAVAKAQAEGALMADYAYMAVENGGFIAVPETKLKAVDAPGGRISFRKLVYITADELQALESGSTDAQALYNKLGTSISELGRK